MEFVSDFDRPFFKKLAHNDTGAAAGHQGGIVIPTTLDKFFPQLSKKVTAESPTVEEFIWAALFVGKSPKGIVSARYQYQTWRGTRKERRLTQNLGPIRNVAVGGDYLVIERSLADPKFYKLTLLRTGTADHVAFANQVGSRLSGPVYINDQPVSETEVDKAIEEQAFQESGLLNLFDNAAALTETRLRRIARSRAFQTRILEIYASKCAVCGYALCSPTGRSEIEAAHIVPRSLKGADDARNGLALCRSHHWAFDRGLFGVKSDGQIVIPSKVSNLAQNAHLVVFESKYLLMPSNPSLSPVAEAFEWHMTNLVSPFM